MAAFVCFFSLRLCASLHSVTDYFILFLFQTRRDEGCRHHVDWCVCVCVSGGGGVLFCGFHMQMELLCVLKGGTCGKHLLPLGATVIFSPLSWTFSEVDRYFSNENKGGSSLIKVFTGDKFTFLCELRHLMKCKQRRGSGRRVSARSFSSSPLVSWQPRRR